MASLHSGKKKLIVLVDGSWCGSETNTKSNIYLLADMIGVPMNQSSPQKAEPITYENRETGTKACYFPGCGLGGTFLEYLFNGATASDMGKDCIETYTYIVKHYSEDYEIWMFGLSRGSFTLRCVAGMINNCGIVKRRGINGELDDAAIDGLCEEVYKIYRSPYEEDHPKSNSTLAFKAAASYDVQTPIKFMGLIDTVGSLGVPKLDAGVGIQYPEFWDQKISSAVEKVYHACAIHDRLWCFEPCRALRDPDVASKNTSLAIHERWFPGCHYDLGRQRFRFLRNGNNFIERSLSTLLGPLAGEIVPNEVLADLVLKWMLESVRAESEPVNTVISGIDDQIKFLISRIKHATREDCGSGDVYGSLLDLGPIGKVSHLSAAASHTTLSWLDTLFPRARPGTAIQDSSGIKFLIRTLAQTRDRRIPHPDAVVTLYKNISKELGDQSVQKLGYIKPDDQSEKRYPSKTYESFKAYLDAMGMRMSTASQPS